METPPTHPPAFDKSLLLEAITNAQATYISAGDPRGVFDALLVPLLRLTGSEYGYIGEVLTKPDGTPFLRTHAISNIAWNEETTAFYEASAPTGLDFYNLKSLFGHVIDKGVVVISNDPASDPRAGGLPPGHPPLNAYLGIPFFADGKLVGSAGISNRRGGYDDAVVDFLKPFTATCANIILANRSKRDRERVERVKREFVSIVSHELRTPMTSIRGSLGLLEGLFAADFEDKAAELVRVAHNGSKRLVRILDDLLDVERLETGGIRLRFGECQLDEVAARSVTECRGLARDAGVELEFQGSTPVTLIADADRLSQVVVNLVSNAIKFSQRGGSVVISTRDGGSFNELIVRDDGRGIPEAELVTIFDKFHQVDDPNTRVGDGFGLGLYIVKSLVERFGGEISVASEVGVGSRFICRFRKSWTPARAST